jgi:hypothetical protein
MAKRALGTDAPAHEREPQGGTTKDRFSGPEFYARVARRAYEFFERRGADHGHDVEDWLEAEREVKEEMSREEPRLG